MYYIRYSNYYNGNILIYQFNSIKNVINKQRWAFNSPVSMVKARLLYSLTGEEDLINNKIINKDRILKSKKELFDEIFNSQDFIDKILKIKEES
jgi:hypothetical protein